MPDETRDSQKRMKHSQDVEDGLARKRKKHKRHTTHDESDIEVVRSQSRHKKPSEVIEVHGSSSEGDASESSHPESSKNRRKHSHSHRKHKKEHSESTQSTSRDSRSERKHARSKEDEHQQSRLKKHKRRERSESEDDETSRKSQEERVLAENVRIKEENSVDVKDQARPKVREEREPRRSPQVQIKRELERNRNDHRRPEEPPSRDRSPRENFRGGGRGRGGRNDQRPGRSGGPSRRQNEGEDNYEWGQQGSSSQPAVKPEPSDKEKPDFKLSGKLTEDTNTFNGVVIKYSEPPESRMPKKRWRLYQFKGEETLPTLYIHRQSAYLIGRDRKVVDLPVDHPSCSKQHAALQYRLITFERPNGSIGKQIRLYVIDLESANGTFINGSKIEAKKYHELMEKDVIKFGFSSREYVLLHEQSKDDESSDDN